MTRVDAKNRPVEGERISEYFDAERGDRYVRRYELQAILVQYDKARRQNTRWSRFWRWLKTPRGKPVHAVEPPAAQVAREAEAAQVAATSEFRRHP